MAAVSDFQRRTPLARVLPGDTVWRSIGDAAVAEHVPSSEPAGDALTIVDLSPLPRLGFKGRDTLAAVRSHGVMVEAEPNRAFRQPDGSLCLVLGAGEVMILGALVNGAMTLALEGTWSIDDGVRSYSLARRDSHAWFALSGAAAPDMMAKLCGVDLRPAHFPDLSIAQTSVAKLNAIVVRADLAQRLTYHLLADSASAAYLWACLCDAAVEFAGRPAGLDALIRP